MTCVAGVKTATGVLLAGDSRGTNDDAGSQATFTAPKVFRLTSEIAVGYCGSFRMGQLLEHHVTTTALRGDEASWAITELVPTIREVLKTHGYTTVENNEETAGSFLLAVRGRLFEVHSDFAVLERDDAYTAIGSGQMVALGAMHALWEPKIGHTPAAARAFLKTALDAAAAFATGVAPPYRFTTTRC